ncbi:unnamed protein product [Bemisia tabaci]|uniref:Sodium/potassium-transporting ATPase subunit beta-2 n=1 Tax=Bemisia tabaci TaxID=7038 RepID=A0A9P0AI34_BEMTA|nr:PREDICTED: sodium/potassium-transporting ATPase subunit beta-2-like [Bemisia tabaci]CAH0393559.1 unnamed protein product [Bemisia tabaci]
MTKDKRVSLNSVQFSFKPEELPFNVRLKRFLYNPETHEYFGRTPISWAKIGLFYLVFYAVLAAMFGILLWLFFLTLDPRIPRYQLEESIIGTNPGLGFRPMPNESNAESSLIWFKGTDPENFKYWTDSLIQFLDVYKRPGLTPGRGQNIFACDYDRPPGRGQVCDVDIKAFAPCTEENYFYYHRSGPCVFLKLNKVYGWKPDFYNDSSQLPKLMPDYLKTHITRLLTTNAKELNTIWVSCEGENPADVENVGAIKYIPNNGFPGYFFPYENSEGYLSPLIAVHFVRPKTGILINIECKAWAKNIIHDRKDRTGSVHFELMID